MSEQTQQTKAESVENQTEDEREVDDHLEDVEDGCGCTEIWEHLSDRREESDE